MIKLDLPADFLPLRAHNAIRNNLPMQLTSFVGREREMAEAKRLLSTTRLLTLTGSGGTGKTRLALHMAGDLLASFEAGVWLIELAPLDDPSRVLQTVVSTLDLCESPYMPLLDIVTD